jgi:hypothetical protein
VLSIPEAQPGDLLVGLRLDSAQNAVAVDRAILPEFVAFSLDSRAEARIALFWIRASDLVHPDGRPLNSEALRRVTVRLARNPPPSAENGACGRCLVPALSRPQVVEDGDSCPIPHFAERRMFHIAGGKAERVELGGDPDQLLGQVRIEWPGDCACVDRAPSRGGALEICPLGAGHANFLPATFALDADGTTFAATQGLASIFDPGTGTIEVRIDPPMRESAAAVAIGGGRFVVSARRGLEMADGSSLRVFDRDGRSALYPDALPGISEVRLVRIGASSMFLAIGDDLQEHRPSIGTCKFDEVGHVSCIPDPIETRAECPETFTLGAQAVGSIAAIDGGDLIALTNAGGLLFRRSSEATWRCAPSAHALPPPGSRDGFARGSMEAIGRRVFLCMSGTESGVLMTGTIPPLSLDSDGHLADFDPGMRMVRSATGAGSMCHTLVRDPEHPDRIYARMFDRGRLEIEEVDRAGTSVATYSSLKQVLRGLDVEPLLAASSTSGWIGVTADALIERRRPGGASFEPLNAASSFDLTQPPALAAGRDREVLAFSPHRAPTRFTIPERAASCGDVAITPAPPSSATVPWDRVDVAVEEDPRSERFFLVGGAGGATRFAIFDASQGTFLELPLTAQESVRFQAIAELAPGKVALLAGDGRLFSASADGTVAAVDPEWDDPATPEIENRPVAFDGWLAIDAGLGVGWVGGKSSLGRVVPNEAGGVRIEGYWLARLLANGGGDVPTQIGSLKSLCPDHVVLSGESKPFIVSPHDLDLWEVRTGLNGLAIGPYPLFNPADPSLPSTGSRRPRGVLGTNGAPTFVFITLDSASGATLFRAGAPRMTLPFDMISSSAESPGLALFARSATLIAAVFERAP